MDYFEFKCSHLDGLLFGSRQSVPHKEKLKKLELLLITKPLY